MSINSGADVREAAKLRLERFVLDHMKLKTRPSASTYQIKNIRQWLTNARDPIDGAEVAFLDKEEDLSPVEFIEKTPLRSFAEKHRLSDIIPCLRQEGVGYPPIFHAFFRRPD